MASSSAWWRSARDAARAQRTPDPASSRIGFGLTAAYKRAGAPQRFDLASGRLVIFSDHHRGKKDGADDFRRCERAYRAALGHYLQSGHTLALLGDVEELWKNQLPEPLKAYPEVLALERAFHERGRLWRFYGNHDLVWAHQAHVDEYLKDVVGDGVEVLEARRLDVYDGTEKVGQIFLTHGHQGTPDSDLFAPLAMLPVRYVWPALQRSVNFASTSPAQDYELRAGHDETMFHWAQHCVEGPLVLITGHTHKPVFRRRKSSGALPTGVPVPTEAQARERLAAAEREGHPAVERAELHAMVEYVATKPYGAPPVKIEPPCYFNTGCCSFGDGNITGIEIADGEIRLVRWLNDGGEPKPHKLDSCPLREILDEVAGDETA
jgi:UDP-2,3-diacylglucosamine pyrophosphatase LpxH